MEEEQRPQVSCQPEKITFCQAEKEIGGKQDKIEFRAYDMETGKRKGRDGYFHMSLNDHFA